MKRSLQILSIALVCLSLYLTAFTSNQNPDEILGVWTSQDGVRTIEIYKQEDSYFGKILENKHQEKDQIVVGTVIMQNFKYHSGKWEGRLFIPSKDADYRTQLSLNEEGSLISTVKLGPFSKSKIWNRINKK